MIYGYARVSTNEQDTALQLDALRKAGAEVIYEEKKSGADRDRKELAKLLASVGSGDVLVVYKLDRLGRSVRHIMEMLDFLAEKGCGFKSLTEPFDTTSALGEFFLAVMAAFAQFERSLIRERCASGIAAARARGVRFGRPERLTDDQKAEVLRLYRSGVTRSAICRKFSVSPDVVLRIVDPKHKRFSQRRERV
ncbi:recombinase family protein [Brachymonas denitrificans]|uniref:recombinase family protein n=1 Tax=Brachymonas denitrificans TaxID=28220 RepID=UPI001BD0285E|nr:recombinase family protein [Brachymonas denitrificans]